MTRRYRERAGAAAASTALRGLFILIAVAMSAGAPTAAEGRDARKSDIQEPTRHGWALAANPVFDRRLHYIGEAWVSFANDGTWGTSHTGQACRRDEEILRINYCPSFEYPGGSRIDYLYNGGLWVGGIVGADTLVSVAYDGWDGPGDEFNGFAPMLEGLPPGYTSGCGAFGQNRMLEQVYYCVYSDTAITANIAASHTPLGLQVYQATHQASDNFARDFVIVDLHLENIGENMIQDLYLGAFQDADCYYEFAGGTPFADDISGFLDTWPNPVDPKFRDTLNVAWAADNDGDPDGNSWPRVSARGVFGWRILRAPKGTRPSYNWWTSDGSAILDWGPRRATDLRDLGHGGRGTPTGDRNKYHYMSNGEIDYGQLLSAQNFTAEGWAGPQAQLTACNLADGLDQRSVLSVGPVGFFAPGETLDFTFAFVGGKDLHRYPDNEFECSDPYPFIANLDFSDLATNSWWAGFVFDNYGVDTDGDGYAGEYYKPVTDFDTAYYTGDGCPDFTGPKPPQGPSASDLVLISRPGELEVVWSGANSELTVDPLQRMSDFEGYKIYYAERNSRDDKPSADDYSLLASWDVTNWRRYTYEPRANIWEVSSHPLTIEQWREVFKDNTCADSEIPFDPRDYTTPSPDLAYCYVEEDRFGQLIQKSAYFAPQDFNQGDTIIVGDQKTPNVIQKIGVRDTIVGDNTLQYGVYRAVLKNLLASKHYFVTVTAFDFGDPFNNLEPLETTPGHNRVDGIPIYSADVVDEFWQEGGTHRDSVRVTVYPNPYKISFVGPDGRRTSYAEQGFEGAFGQDVGSITDADRRIHFINVPDTATIRIYSLDGDLIRELHHPDPNLSSYSSKISWDLVSRNTQAVESGIYIYRVDSHLGAQIGKLVIIK